jgi:hypothetical protein
VLKASTTTAADGSYGFTGIAEGHYFVRVPIATVRSTRLGSSTTLLGVQTYRYEASWTSPGAVTDEIGGMDPAAPDGAAGVSSYYAWTACSERVRAPAASPARGWCATAAAAPGPRAC